MVQHLLDGPGIPIALGLAFIAAFLLRGAAGWVRGRRASRRWRHPPPAPPWPENAKEGEPPPPWVAAPYLLPTDPATQGAEAAYVDLTFLPFWKTLSLDQKADYLNRWSASEDWRHAIAEAYDHVGIDLEAEAREAEAWAAAQPKPKGWGPFRRR